MARRPALDAACAALVPAVDGPNQPGSVRHRLAESERLRLAEYDAATGWWLTDSGRARRDRCKRAARAHARRSAR